MKKSILCFALLLTTMATSCAKKSADSPVNSPADMAATESVANEQTVAVAPNVHQIPTNISGKDALEKIKAEHKGKVVLIDFWATWCPPCIAAMQTIKEIKPALKEKGAVFVYITGETSPEEDYTQIVPTIDGEHYRLTDKQWAEIGTLLGMRGIPAFMLIGKDGNVAYSNTTEGGYPGNELIKNQIEVALTK
ncbi:MAG: redoxin family protein [Bacteroidales bacterium]|nr:redoxin family protein [Bacteroidales bacterium]